ncbi:hydrolase, NUDIX family [Oesophagostomum dentatum]|uniref:Hydrolase, NUDIX family n=1 Tax=Oesophagostomum dentatum TaxID=61180 RepID=A0A0B1T0B4_OESDE|nr:hydrolase, NUDIX family [Oesophagostomum dentatum]
MRSSLSAIGNVTKEQFLKKVAEKNSIPWHPRLSAAESNMSVLVPLLVVNSKLSVLFTKRSIHLKQHRGEVCFPGGKMESEETAEETALRETHEEIGVDPKSVEVWGRLKPVLTRTLVETVVPVVGCTNEDALNSKLINKNEVQTLFSAPLDELCQTARYTHFSTKMVDFKLPVFFTKEFTVHSHNEGEFLHNEFRIWGLSAVMLHQLLCIMTPEKYNTTLRLKFY